MDLAHALKNTIPAGMQLTLAPDFYDPLMLPRLKGALGIVATEMYHDYNYSYPLTRYSGLCGRACPRSPETITTALAVPVSASLPMPLRRESTR